MNKKRHIFSNKGFTLVEIIVAIAIASIVSLMVLRLFSFSTTVFNRSEDRSFNQMSVRNASIAVTDKIRYAKNLEMLKENDIPSGKLDIKLNSVDQEYKYLYFNKDDESLSLIEWNKEKEEWLEKKFLREKLNLEEEYLKEKTTLEDDVLSYFMLEEIPEPIEPNENKRKIEQLTFKISGKGDKYKDKENNYSLDTKVNLLNSDLEEFEPKGDRDKTYRGVRFK